MASSKGSRKKGAIARQAGYAKARRKAAGELRGLDGALAKLKARKDAGENLSAAQLEFLRSHGFT